MSVEQIQKMYDNMYSTKYNDLVKNKTSALSELDKQSAENNENFYNQRNQAAYENANSKRSIRDYMAKNNLLQSGESVDALLRNSTDYSNSMGTINSNETKAKNEILNNRNKINSEFDGNVAAAKAEIEAQKIQAILEWQQQQAELELQRQQIAASRARSYSSGGSSSSSSGYSAPGKESALLEVDEALKAGRYDKVYNLMNDPQSRAYAIDKYGKKFMEEVNQKYLARGGTTFNNSFNAKRYARQSSKY